MVAALSILGVLVVLAFNEWWWRQREHATELSRKFAHIVIGSGAAFAPFFLSWPAVRWLGAAAFVTVLISKYFHLLKAIHSVQRATFGELYFALAILTTAILTTNKWIFAAGMLEMGLADGLAAVMGVSYGRAHRYQVLRHTKSILGTGSFFVVSILILVAFGLFSGTSLGLAALLGISIVATVIENFGIGGLDNLLVPVVVVLLLRAAT